MPKLFVCHAHEDKSEVARPLADALLNADIEVWYDDYSLKLGDSLRRAIEKGLAEADYGVVILSSAFFEKEWPQAELNGLFAKEMTGQKTILPVWHAIDTPEILQYSPILADKYAAKTSDGLDRVVAKILDVVVPEKSHRTLSGKTVSVTPDEIRLHTGKRAVKTPLRIFNHDKLPVYSVSIMLELDPLGLDSNTVCVDTGEPTTSIEARIGNVMFSPDRMLYHLINSENRELLVIVLHTIDPRTSKEVVVEGGTAIFSNASVKLWSFQQNPPEILSDTGEISTPFQIPESFQMKGMTLRMKKIS